MNLQEIERRIKNIPEKPGCYLWLGEIQDTKMHNKINLKKYIENYTFVSTEFETTRQILYVGKAVQLRKRVSQYLNIRKSTNRNHTKTNFLLLHVKAVDWIVTNNEAEALLLENNLIKEYNPPYNVRLKDNKCYPFICLSMGEAYPRLTLTRKKKKNTDQYFGPYPDVKAARNTIQFIHKIFPIRKRPLKLPLKKPAKPCMNFHIKRCWAPCTGKITEEEYATMINQIKDLLEGNTKKIKDDLIKKRHVYSSRMQYEKAARIQNIMQDMEKVTEKQEVHSSDESTSLDIVATHNIQRKTLFKELKIDEVHTFSEQHLNNFLGETVLLKIRYGKLMSKQNFPTTELNAHLNQKPEAVFLSSFLRDYYLNAFDYPEFIYLSHNIDDRTHWEELLSKKVNRPISIISPNKNVAMNYKGLITMAVINAKSLLKERNISEHLRNQRIGLKQIQQFLHLKKLPVSIECYDISNLQGKEAVGAGIFFKNGLPHKLNYRKYKIQLKNEPNDPAMMYEVLNRRFARVAKKEIPPADLVLVDGGIAQLNAALRARENYNLDIPIASLAKKEEEIYLSEGKILKIDVNSPGMLILRAARDEAHRFSLRYHRALRAKKIK